MGSMQSEHDYQQGMDDGLKGLPPNIDRMALGANYINDYERGYIDSGKSGGFK